MAQDIIRLLKQRYWQNVILLLAAMLIVYLSYPLFFNVQAEYLNTDILIFFLLSVFIVFIAYIRKQPHLSEPWKQVFKNKIAMSSAVVLCFFVVVGLMDSVHFRKSGTHSLEMLSVLDVSLEYINKRTEKTYSAPFAIYSYAKENFSNDKGVKYRDYPRLKYAGSHIKEAEHTSDILKKSLLSILVGSALAGFVVVLFVLIFSYKHSLTFKETVKCIMDNSLEFPWKVALLSIVVLILLFNWLFYMSAYYHVMGTDKVGQDVFYLTLKSIRTGLVIGTLTTLIMLPFAIALGVMAGYFKGWVDDVIQYIYTTLNSIPGILLIVAVMLAIDVYIENHQALFSTAVQRADIKLLALCGVLGITSWTGLCRLLRGEAFKLRELEYIQAATALGVSHFRIIVSHIVPNVMHIVLIVVVLDFSGLVLAEAVLAYIGVGVDPSTISWGNMINSARFELAREPAVWWSLLAAFSFMFALVLAANLFADAIRDAFDPRMQGVK